ncbi:MAG TPA: CHAT domain-containing tetratricopeptide repeat protein, partial [Thermoanaerobaculia bacterium]|jgi:CHAT domain-containing protein/Flp pilus assembly protein TadD
MDSENGEYERALGELEKALEIRQSGNKSLAVAEVLNALGRLYSNLEDTDTALRLHGQALEILRQNPDDATMASTLTHLGDAHRKRKHFSRAIELYLQALTLTQRSGLPDDPSTLNNLAVAYLHLQRYTEALHALRHCEQIFKSQGNVRAAAVAWTNIGWVLTAMGRYKAAFDAYMQSLAMVREEDRPPTQAATYFGMAWTEWKRGNLIAARRFLTTALDFVESLRTKAYRAELRTSYLAGRQDFYDLLVEILMEQHRREPAKGYDLQAFEASEKARSRSLLDVLEGQPVIPALSVRDIQKQALGEEVVLLEYFLGEERSFLWIVTSSSFASRELPPRRQIASLAQKVHRLLGASNRLENRSEAIRKATELSRILFGTIAKNLAGKRILIVAPPALQYISFGALPADVTTPRRAGGAWPIPWMQDHEMVVEPSATALVTLRRKRAGHRPPSELMAVVADPVYSRADERAGRLKTPSSTRERPSLSRLHFSQREVDAIEEQVQGAQRLLALGFDANRQMVLAGRLSDYTYLHFSTHGSLDTDQPERSAIALSFLDRDGKEINGYLRAGEIAALQLPADLVVLSACKTGLGREIRGEGLVGLTQAFFSAGASRVVVSLWDVDAQATADLMGRFYRDLFHKDLAPAAALREAQEWMWRQPKWNAPAYWAGFVLQGEWQ